MDVAKISGMNPVAMGFGKVVEAPGVHLPASVSNLTVNEVAGNDFVDFETEADVQLDDDLGRLFEGAYHYQAPTMPNFAALAAQEGAEG